MLIISHGSAASWSNHRPSPFPTPDKARAERLLDDDAWQSVFVGNIEQLATEPNGETGEVRDTVLVLKRF